MAPGNRDCFWRRPRSSQLHISESGYQKQTRRFSTRWVWNYSWPLFQYVWNEIKFQIAYQSDLQFVAETMQRIVEEDLGEEMVKSVEVYRELLARTPVDQLEVRSRSRVIFRVEGKDQELLGRLERKLGKTKEDLRREMESL